MEIQASQVSAHQQSTVNTASTQAYSNRPQQNGQATGSSSFGLEPDRTVSSASISNASNNNASNNNASSSTQSATYTLMRNGVNTAMQSGVLRLNETASASEQQSRVIEHKSNRALTTFLSVSENSANPHIIDTYV